MRLLIPFALATLGLLLARCGGLYTEKSACTRGQPWRTVDDFRLSAVAGQQNHAAAVVAGASGRVYAVGYGMNGSSVIKWTVRMSTDGGASWSTVDVFNPANSTHTSARAVSIDSEGRPVVAGYLDDTTTNWVVRRGNSSGGGWTELRSIEGFGVGGQVASASAIVSLPAGSLAVGGDEATGGQPRATVEIFDGSSSWNAVASPLLNFVPSGSVSAVVRGMAAFGLEVFAVGTSSTPAHWWVQGSTDGGKTWSLLDQVQRNSGRTSSAAAVTRTPDGTLVVVGAAHSESDVGLWQVRLGQGWSDTYSHPGSSNDSLASGVYADASGIFVVGYATDAQGVVHWIVRRSIDDGKTWTTMDDYQLVSGNHSESTGLSADSEGNLYAVGTGSESGTNRWIVRKLPCH